MYYPVPRRVAWLAAWKASEREIVHARDMERLITADIAHAECAKRAKQYGEGAVTAVDPWAEPVQVIGDVPLEQLLDEINQLRCYQLAIFVGRRDSVDPGILNVRNSSYPNV